MNKNNKRKNNETDSSEVFKRKSLTASRIRKQMKKYITWLLYAAAIFVLAACVYAYFLDA